MGFDVVIFLYDFSSLPFIGLHDCALGAIYIYGRKSFPLGWCRGAKFIDCLIDDFTFKWRRKCWGIKIVSYLNRRGHNNERRWLGVRGGRAGVCIRYKKTGDLYIDRIQYHFVGSNLMTV
jgi:hypothetical protein